MAGPMDIFGVDFETLEGAKDYFKNKPGNLLSSDSVVGGTADKIVGAMNPALANTFEILSLKSLQDKVPTFAEMDESQEETVKEKLVEQAQAMARLGLNITDFLAGGAANAYRKRQDKLASGMDKSDIIKEK